MDLSQSSNNDQPDTEDPKSKPDVLDLEKTVFRALIHAIRTRILGGLVVIAPIVVTFWLLTYLYRLIRDTIVQPLIQYTLQLLNYLDLAQIPALTPDDLPWWIDIVGFLLVISAMFSGLYFIGLLARSRIVTTVEWLMLRVPLIAVIYRAVRNVLSSLERQSTSNTQVKRVVLVEFPHPGMKVPGFVTSSCIDHDTGKKILCVYVPTTPVPTSGYMLLVPEESVTELDWTVDETIQGIISGGISVPEQVNFYSQKLLESATSTSKPEDLQNPS